MIEEEEEFTPNHLIELEKQYKPARIIIEYNGMWNCKNMTLPWYWKVEQQITTIDGSTFPMYYTNMKSLLAEMIRKSEMIIFNRCDGIKDLNVYKRNIKAVNPSADVIFEDSNGEIDEIFEEDLPYDLNQDPIVLATRAMASGIWIPWIIWSAMKAKYPVSGHGTEARGISRWLFRTGTHGNDLLCGRYGISGLCL